MACPCPCLSLFAAASQRSCTCCFLELVPNFAFFLELFPDFFLLVDVPSVDPNDQKKTACYDIDVEVDDTLKTQMNSFLLSTASQQEIAALDNKVGKAPSALLSLLLGRDVSLNTTGVFCCLETAVG